MKSRALSRSRRGELADVGAADKGALAGAGQDHEPQRRIGFELLDGLDDLGHQRPVEGVELGRVVDRQPREMAAFRPLLAGNQDTIAHSRRGASPSHWRLTDWARA